MTVAEDADGQARSRKRMTTEHVGGDAELAPDRADLVLEEITERLDELEAELLGEAADVVVAS